MEVGPGRFVEDWPGAAAEYRPGAVLADRLRAPAEDEPAASTEAEPDAAADDEPPATAEDEPAASTEDRPGTAEDDEPAAEDGPGIDDGSVAGSPTEGSWSTPVPGCAEDSDPTPAPRSRTEEPRSTPVGGSHPGQARRGPPPAPGIRCSGVSGSTQRRGTAAVVSPRTTSASVSHSTSPPLSTSVTTVSPEAAPGTVPAARWVATNGPGSRARPASSKTSTVSGTPSPPPPSASGTRSAKNPAAPSSRHSSRSRPGSSAAARNASPSKRRASSSRIPARNACWSSVS